MAGMGLQKNIEEISRRKRDRDASESIQQGRMEIRSVYGKDLKLGVYEREDYQTAPHVHTAEQINYILEGQVWWFVEDEGFLLSPGDFHRVPSDAVHWAKTETTPIKMIEAHAPPLAIGPNAEGLYADDETPEPNETSENIAVDVDGWEEIQERAMERYYEEHPEDR